MKRFVTSLEGHAEEKGNTRFGGRIGQALHIL
jgi:hypothetical protein